MSPMSCVIIQHAKPRQWTQLTVKDGLAQGHDRRGVGDQKCGGTDAPSNHLVPLQQPGESLGDLLRSTSPNSRSIVVDNPEVVDVTDSLEDIQDSLRSREAIMGIEGGPTVDIVDLSVQRIRCPDGRVQSSTRHAMWSQQDIARVPDDQGN